MGFGIADHDPWLLDSNQHSSMGKLHHCQCHSREGFHLNNVYFGSQGWLIVFYSSIFRTASVSQGFALYYNYSICWKENNLKNVLRYRIILIHRILIWSSSNHYSNSFYYFISNKPIIPIEKANNQKNKRVGSLAWWSENSNRSQKIQALSKESLAVYHKMIERSFWALALLATQLYVSLWANWASQSAAVFTSVEN